MPLKRIVWAAVSSHSTLPGVQTMASWNTAPALQQQLSWLLKQSDLECSEQIKIALLRACWYVLGWYLLGVRGQKGKSVLARLKPPRHHLWLCVMWALNIIYATSDHTKHNIILPALLNHTTFCALLWVQCCLKPPHRVEFVAKVQIRALAP